MNIQKSNRDKIHRAVGSQTRNVNKALDQYVTKCGIIVALVDGYSETPLKVTCLSCQAKQYKEREEKNEIIFFIDDTGALLEFDNLQELYKHLEEHGYEAGDIIQDLERSNMVIIRGSYVLVKPIIEVKEKMIGLEEV